MSVRLSLIFIFLVGCISTKNDRTIASTSQDVTYDGSRYNCRLTHPLAQSVPFVDRFKNGGQISIQANFAKDQKCVDIEKSCEICREKSGRKEALIRPKKIQVDGLKIENPDYIGIEKCIDEQIESYLLLGDNKLPTKPANPFQEALYFAYRGYPTIVGQKADGFYLQTFKVFRNLAQLVNARCVQLLPEGPLAVKQRVNLEGGYSIQCRKSKLRSGLPSRRFNSRSRVRLHYPRINVASHEMIKMLQRQLIHKFETLVKADGKDQNHVLQTVGISRPSSNGIGINHPDYRDGEQSSIVSTISGKNVKSLSEYMGDLEKIDNYDFYKNIMVPCEALEIDVTEDQSSVTTSAG